MGARFLATPEAIVRPSATKAILTGSGQDTERSTVLDIVRGSGWPSPYSARTIRHPFAKQWRSARALRGVRFHARRCNLQRRPRVFTDVTTLADIRTNGTDR